MPDLTAQILPRIIDHRFQGLPHGDNLVMPNYEGLSLVNLPATVTRLLGVPEFSGVFKYGDPETYRRSLSESHLITGRRNGL